MKIEIHGSRANLRIDLDLGDLKKQGAFAKWFDKIKDFFCGTKLAEAKAQALIFMDENNNANERKEAFLEMYRLCSEPFKDHFKIQPGGEDEVSYQICSATNRDDILNIKLSSLNCEDAEKFASATMHEKIERIQEELGNTTFIGDSDGPEDEKKPPPPIRPLKQESSSDKTSSQPPIGPPYVQTSQRSHPSQRSAATCNTEEELSRLPHRNSPWSMAWQIESKLPWDLNKTETPALKEEKNSLSENLSVEVQKGILKSRSDANKYCKDGKNARIQFGPDVKSYDGKYGKKVIGTGQQGTEQQGTEKQKKPRRAWYRHDVQIEPTKPKEVGKW